MGNIAHWATKCHTHVVTEISLRETKRRNTAHALARTAFELARERGVDGFTIDEVASRAGYSRRTFANHFAGKEEAIVAVAVEQVRSALDTPPDDDLALLDWLQAVARKQLGGGLLTVLHSLRALAAENPSLRPHLLEVHQLIRDTALQAVLSRISFPGSKAYAHVLVGAAYGALTCVMEGKIALQHEAAPTPATADREELALDDFLDLTFTHLRHGF